jgi:hypothetical protein
MKIRQGDVILIPILAAAIPAGLTEVPRDNGWATLAYGEVTGHSHAMLDNANAPTVKLMERPGTTERYLFVDQDTALGHGVFSKGSFADAGEHGTLPVVAPSSFGFGAYEVRIQSQYSPEAVRRVVD